MKIVMPNDIRYEQQMEALDEIAAKLGAVACRPACHGSMGDKNSVLLYTLEDAEHNRMVDRQPARYSRKEAADIKRCKGSKIPEQYIYQDFFWSFENSDVNGLFDLDYANRGVLDLRRPDWKERLEGHIGLALLKKRQRQYVQFTGGWGELRESDEKYNSFNRSMIACMKKAYGCLYLGSVNYYGSQRKRICAGKESVYKEYTDQMVYNFACAFAVPVKDARLEELIRDWNMGKDQIDEIMHRIDELGGENFVWY